MSDKIKPTSTTKSASLEKWETPQLHLMAAADAEVKPGITVDGNASGS